MTAQAFHNRTKELKVLTRAFDALANGTPNWIAIIGQRKIGKTSLLLEAARRRSSTVDVVIVDVLEMLPLTADLFRLLALRTLDALFSAEAGASFERAADKPEEFRRLLDRSPSFTSLTAELRTEVRELGEVKTRPEMVRRLLQLPEELAKELDRRLVIAIDEFQELAALGIGRTGFDPFPVMRAVWQRHNHVAYVISGSAPSMLEQLVTSRRSPFFQHFQIMRLGPFNHKDAVELLVQHGPPEQLIPPDIANRCVAALGGNPFYLQLAGETLTMSESALDQQSMKFAIQELVFSRTGRLGLFFSNEYQRLVGNATTLAATLEALSSGPKKLTEIANAIGATAPSTARYLERLGDAVERKEDRTFCITDPIFAQWVQWRSPGGTVVPMAVLGDEAELAVAKYLAALGFDVVYQPKASRGAFDLLALRGATQLGLQVKRGKFPLRFSKSGWNRMDADAARWGCQWAIASVDHSGEVRILDPADAQVGREIRISETASIANLLRWLDN